MEAAGPQVSRKSVGAQRAAAWRERVGHLQEFSFSRCLVKRALANGSRTVVKKGVPACYVVFGS